MIFPNLHSLEKAETMLVNTPCMRFTEDNFRIEVLESQVLVLVDCWASWCCTLQEFNVIFNDLAISFDGQIKVGRLNIATSQQLASHYGIRVVPTLLFFQDGQMVERVVGSLSQQQLANKVSALLTVKPLHRSQIACL